MLKDIDVFKIVLIIVAEDSQPVLAAHSENTKLQSKMLACCVLLAISQVELSVLVLYIPKQPWEIACSYETISDLSVQVELMIAETGHIDVQFI